MKHPFEYSFDDSVSLESFMKQREASYKTVSEGEFTPKRSKVGDFYDNETTPYVQVKEIDGYNPES